MPGRRTVSTAAVVVALFGLAVWGFWNDWRMPSFAALNGTATTEADDWCSKHGVPNSQCIECKPDLVPKLKDHGWCDEHGVHNCTLHHPGLAQLNETPRISTQQLARAERALTIKERPQNNSRAKAYTTRIQFVSEDAMRKAGVDVDPVEEQPVTEELTASGEISYNQTRMAHLSSRLPGTVWRVSKEVGNTVKQGDILALIDAAELGKAKANLLQAIVQVNLRKANYERLQGLQDTVAGRVILEAKSALSAAQVELLGAQQALANLGLPVALDELSSLSETEITRRLQFAGLPQPLVETLNPTTTTTNLLPVTAPFDSVILERDIVSGEVVDSQKTLFAIADPREMWLNLRVPQEDAPFLRMGQTVRFQADGAKSETTGKITWISTSIDEKTRTIEVRALLENEAGLLRAHAFGKGRIVLRQEPKAIVIPSEAIHSDGLSNLVFVRDKNFFKEGSPKFFHVREVRTGTTIGDATEIIAGLLPGEVIATKGSGALLAQLQKSNLGAGCCGND